MASLLGIEWELRMKIAYGNIRYTTKRLLIRPYRVGDYSEWKKAHAACSVAKDKFDPGRLPPQLLTRERFKSLIANYRALARRDEYYMFGIFDKKSGAHLGHFDFFLFARKGLNWANLGYEIHNTHWRKGYGVEAGQGALRIGFKKLKLHRIEAAMELDHKGSQIVARRIGMRRECIRKRFYKSGAIWEDLLVFYITK